MKTLSLFVFIVSICSANLAVCAGGLAVGALLAWKSGLFEPVT